MSSSVVKSEEVVKTKRGPWLIAVPPSPLPPPLYGLWNAEKLTEDDMCPSLIKDDNVDTFFKRKLSLLKYLLNAQDLIEEAEEYFQLFGVLAYGTTADVNPHLHNRVLLADTLRENGHFQLVVLYWELLRPSVTTLFIEAEESRKVLACVVNFMLLVSITWNCTAFCKTDYLKAFGDSLASLYLQVLCLPDVLGHPKSRCQPALVRAMLGALSNFVSRHIGGSDKVRDCDGVRIVGRYMSHPDLTNKTFAILVMCYIVKESESSKLRLKKEHIQYLLNVLDSCMHHVGREHVTEEGVLYDIAETLQGLNRLAVSDKNKRTLVKCGALPLYAELLREHWGPDEQAAACEGLWRLAFLEKNRRLIAAHSECMEGIRKLRSSTDPKVKKAADGAFWIIEQERKRRYKQASRPVREKSGHIMISYNWGVQHEVIKIKDKLKQFGLKVWIDVEKMSGSTLEAMAKSVEDAAVVLIFYTEQYKLSVDCQSEASYCYKLRKPFIPVKMQHGYVPDGWLGILIGTRLYYDFTKPGMWEKMCENLRRGINDIITSARNSMKISKGPSNIHSLAMSEQQNTQSSQVDVASQLQCNSWTENEVKIWLRENSLENCVQRLQGLAGYHIAELRYALLSAPSYYYNVLQNELRLSITEVLTFTRLVREIK